MGSRNFAQVAPTPATMALNAYIFGYGGHSLVTPHATLKQLWWTDERIEKKVTPSFVVSKLRGEEREFLNKPLAFGEGLTDDTYMEWIMTRAKRLFFILTEIGVSDQIFGCIDDSWDDDDLPIPLESVQKLELAFPNDESLNRRFYDAQYLYLLRELKQTMHIDYGRKEHIPMEYVNTFPPAVSLQSWGRIHFPGEPHDIFMRRKYSITDKDGQKCREGFMRDVRKAKGLAHEHIARTWASYTSEDSGFVISDFVAEHTLGSFIDHRTPPQLMKLPASERPKMLCQWMHCLADALASLHHRRVAHKEIRPSNIWIDRNNRIAFADVGSLPTFQRGKNPDKTEVFNYAAPEAQICKEPFPLIASPPPSSSIAAFSKLRKMSTSTSDTSSSSTTSSGGSSTRSNSIISGPSLSPITPLSPMLSSSTTTLPSLTSPSMHSRASRSIRNFSRHLPRSCPTPSVPMSPTSTDSSGRFPRPSYIDPDSLCDLPEAAPEMSDVFSLGCVCLDILTFMLKGRVTDFVKFRTTRVSVPGRTKARIDTSFHAAPDRILAWMDLLEGESCRNSGTIFRAVPELLKLVRQMMSQNATLRPTATQVRDRLEEILLSDGGMEALCCAGREWDLVGAEDDAGDQSSPFRRKEERDELSIATGMVDMSPPQNDTVAGAAARIRSQKMLSGGVDRAGGDKEAGILSRTASAAERRQSISSTSTPRIGSWRKALFRSR